MLSPSVSTDSEWRDSADCNDLPSEAFYGSSESLPMSKAEIHLAKSVCFSCPVRVNCLLDAVDRADIWGVQGGLTGPERQRAVRLYPDQGMMAAAHAAGVLERRVVTHRG